MNIKFINPGFDYSIKSIMLFQNEDTENWWRDVLFHFYPQFDRKAFNLLGQEWRHIYLRDNLQKLKEIEVAFSDTFKLDCHNRFNNIIGNITLNPICPRFLDTCKFDIFYLNDENDALGIAVHETIHFVWFNVWQRIFKDDKTEYETPNLKWIFSEAAVDAITRNDKRFSEKYPFTEYAYQYFYDMRVENVCIIEMLNDIYKSTDIIGFMKNGFVLFIKHEAEIREPH